MQSKFSNIDPTIIILVIVKYKGEIKIYLSNKEYWVMDYAKYHNLDEDIENFPDRFDIIVLDNNNIERFEECVKQYQIQLDEIQIELRSRLPIESWDDLDDIMPSLYLDFDQKRLYSLYRDMWSFEDYIPKGWVGSFENFYHLIPAKYQYWIIDGENLLHVAQ